MIFIRDINKKLEKIDIDTSNVENYWPNQTRTTSYQKFFRGWSVTAQEMPDGRIKKKRIYTGKLFSPDLTPKERTRKKISSLLLAILGAVFLILGIYHSSSAGTVWYVYIPHAACLFGFAVLLWYTIYQLTLPEKLTVSDYRSNARGLMVASFVLPVVLSVTAVLTIIHSAIHGFSTDGILSALLLVASAFAAYPVFLWEYNTSYHEVPNENAPKGYSP